MSRTPDLSAPQGVRGRNSDNAVILDRLGWEPNVSLQDGMTQTYNSVAAEIQASD